MGDFILSMRTHIERSGIKTDQNRLKHLLLHAFMGPVFWYMPSLQVDASITIFKLAIDHANNSCSHQYLAALYTVYYKYYSS